MKILLCTPTFRTDTHGPAKFAQHLFQINKRFFKYELMVLTEDPPREDDSRIRTTNVSCPRPFHALINLMRAVNYHRKSLKLRKSYPFDIIIFNNAIHGVVSGFCMQKNVITLGLINDSLNVEVGRFRDYRGPFRKWLIRHLFRFFEYLASKQMDAIVVNSGFLKKEVKRFYKIPEQKIFKLFKGIDLNLFRFHPDREIILGETIRVLFVKSNYKVGGLFDLIDALGLLISMRFELIVIGPKRDQELHIKGKVGSFSNVSMKFLGPCQSHEVANWMVISDILSVPSRSEALGVANIEGLACGIPVVSTNVGGIPEVLGNGAFGWLAKSGNVEDLSSCLLQCLTRDEWRKEKSLAGRRFVEDNFRHTQMLDRFLSILEEF